MSKTIPLQPGQYYHVYTRGNNRETIFRQERNYRHFLHLFAKHVLPVAHTYAYCLLPNHLHLLIRVKTPPDDDASEPKYPSQCFSNLFNAYAKAFNKMYRRTGTLFQRPFGRIHVASDAYFTRLITYIHQNPQRHGLVDDFRAWPYSSYHAIRSADPTYVQRDEVLAWFGGLAGLETVHEQKATVRQIAPLVPEELD